MPVALQYYFYDDYVDHISNRNLRLRFTNNSEYVKGVWFPGEAALFSLSGTKKHLAQYIVPLHGLLHTSYILK